MSDVASQVDYELAERIARHLNDLLAVDPAALNYLLSYRVSASPALQACPHVVCSTGGDVGLLGLLQGLCGLQPDGRGPLQAKRVNHQITRVSCKPRP